MTTDFRNDVEGSCPEECHDPFCERHERGDFTTHKCHDSRCREYTEGPR